MRTARCPECGSAAIARYRQDPPWCTECEWNLGTWPAPRQRRGARAALRDRRRAFAANRRLLTELAVARPQRPRPTRTRVVLATAAFALLLLDVGLVAGGGYLLLAGRWQFKILAVLLILIGLECRIRFPRLKTDGAVTRREMPELWGVVDTARAALGAPPIDHLLLTDDVNAACGRSGLRRRTVLSLGVPLWGALSPAGRQALLGHELGHLINADPRSAFTTQPALTTFDRLATIFRPAGLIDAGEPIREFVTTVVAYTVYWPIHAVCRRAHRLLERIAAPDHQRAEVYADALAVRLGGSAGAEEISRFLLFAPAALDALRRAWADGLADPDEWRAEVAAALAAGGPDPRVAEQASLRYASSLADSHPPAGLRLRLVRSWPASEPARPVPVERLAAADRELAARYARLVRAVPAGR